MQTWVIQNQDFNGNVERSSEPSQNFYLYSLWRAQTGEHLFDGAAGDIAEALDTLHAHINFLTAERRRAVAAS
jgi:hypothetical protein